MMIMGHRGAAALEPENTIRSIARAMEIGVDAVEIDVHLSKDEEVVVIHDETLDRTTNGTGPVKKRTLEELKMLDAGKGEKIPTLQEVMDFVGDKMRLVIELKEAGAEGKVVELIKNNAAVSHVYVISFWHRLVQAVKSLEGTIKTGVLLVGCPVDLAVASNAFADALVMRYSFVDERFVKMAHKKGLKVFIWNIDDPDLLEPYVAMGVDGIGSNDPRVLVDYFGSGNKVG
jgi:glycerophosphoryl diester phosphodiesterase